MENTIANKHCQAMQPIYHKVEDLCVKKGQLRREIWFMEPYMTSENSVEREVAEIQTVQKLSEIEALNSQFRQFGLELDIMQSHLNTFCNIGVLEMRIC